jgi:chloride channel 3/4/5
MLKRSESNGQTRHTAAFGKINVPPSPPSESLEDVHAFELTENGQLWNSNSSPESHYSNTKYADGDSIDWLHEDAAERARQHALRGHQGLRGLAKRTLDASRMWSVLIATGVGIGVVGAWLDVLVKWLGDLREGRCSYGIFYNSVACCQGLDAGEVCMEWQTWSQYVFVFLVCCGAWLIQYRWLGVRSILGQSLLQAMVYIVFGVCTRLYIYYTFAY